MASSIETSVHIALASTIFNLGGSSVAKQFGIILGGGIAPLAGTTLVGATGSFSSVIVYFDIIAVVAFIGLFYARKARKPIGSTEKESRPSGTILGWVCSPSLSRKSPAAVVQRCG